MSGVRVFIITLDGIPLLGYFCKKGYDYDQKLWRQDNRKDFQWRAS